MMGLTLPVLTLLTTMMMMMMMMTTITLFTMTMVAMVTALPNGSPVCTIGEAAPQNLHLDPARNPQLGHLADVGFYIKIGNTILRDTTTVYDYDANVDLPVVVTSDSGGQPFKGVLIVASVIGADLTANLFLEGESNLVLRQSQCDAGRAAVTHINNNTKSAVTATMNFDENFDVVLVDVNIVVVNNAKASIFYWDQYRLRITGAAPSPTPVPDVGCGLFGMSFLCLPKVIFCGAIGRLLGQDQSVCLPTTPTMSPTKRPTKAPTKALTKSPTKPPTKAPTNAPTNAPTKAPTKRPTKAPTKRPTKAPTKRPTKSPTRAPTKAPTRAPTKSPTKRPTKSPTKAPTKAPTSAPVRCGPIQSLLGIC